MNKKLYILLDRSGSMENIWEESINGINNYAENVGDVDVTLAAFDTMGYDVIRSCPASEWKKVTRQDVWPRGGTPLLDAAGRIMWQMKDSEASRAVLVIVTDGHENASTRFKSAEIRDLTTQLKNKDYEIVFLGANFDGIKDVAAQNFGVHDSSKWMATSARGMGQAFSTTATASAGYYSTGATMSYSPEDKAKAKQ